MKSQTLRINESTSSNLRQFFFLLLGLVICGYFFYIRIILRRLPKEINSEWNCLRFTVYVSLFIIFVSLFLKKIRGRESKLRIVIALKENVFIPLLRIYDTSLMRVHDYFIDENRIPIKPFIEKLIDNLYKYINHLASKNAEPSYLTIYCVINLIPRALVLMGLLTDVFVFEKFEYTYKMMPLLILPLIFNVVCYIIREFVSIQMELLEYLVDIETQESEGALELICSTKKDLSPEAEEQFTPELLNTLTEIAKKYISIQQNFLVPFGPQSTLFTQTVYHIGLLLIYLLSATIWGYLAIYMGYPHMLLLIMIYLYL